MSVPIAGINQHFFFDYRFLSTCLPKSFHHNNSKWAELKSYIPTPF